MLADLLTTTLPDDLRRARRPAAERTASPTPRASCPSAPTRTHDPHRAVWRLAADPGLPARARRDGRGQATGEQLPGSRASRTGLPGALARHALGELAAAVGDPEAAAELYAEAGARLPGDLDDPDLIPWRAGAAMALTHLRRHREAADLAEAHLARAARARLGVRRRARPADARRHRDRRRPDRPAPRGAARPSRACRADRLAAQVDTDLAVLITLQHGAGAREEAVAPAPRRRGVRRPRGPVPAPEPGPPPARSGSASSRA